MSDSTLERSRTESLLQVRDLTIHYGLGGATEIHAVNGVSFDLGRGELVGLIGESGSGKTTLGLALLSLLPPSSRVVGGSVRFRGRELLEMNERQLQQVRGAEISIILQEPGMVLNPVLRVGDQIAEVIRAHRPWDRARCRREAEFLLSQVHLSDTSRFYSAYAHQLSGGQRQRVIIAQALACGPKLLVADEPTSALDTPVQAEILTLLRELKETMGISLLLVSHNPAILARLADRVMVMYAGRIVEDGTFAQICRNPLHPYTKGLLESFPRPSAEPLPRGKRPLCAIVGNPPNPAHLPPGCAFAPRCPDRMEVCTARVPRPTLLEASRRVECFLYGS